MRASCKRLTELLLLMREVGVSSLFSCVECLACLVWCMYNSSDSVECQQQSIWEDAPASFHRAWRTSEGLDSHVSPRERKSKTKPREEKKLLTYIHRHIHVKRFFSLSIAVRLEKERESGLDRRIRRALWTRLTRNTSGFSIYDVP